MCSNSSSWRGTQASRGLLAVWVQAYQAGGQGHDNNLGKYEKWSANARVAGGDGAGAELDGEGALSCRRDDAETNERHAWPDHC
jgi:hypothetical protein